ncbi:MAG: ATP-binding protein [Zoogloeaceae bacterium]|jgi:DNA transposition AAA+ family ATPase|nr:ATP-binding protein [Zoogloeaceae bacterium]
MAQKLATIQNMDMVRYAVDMLATRHETLPGLAVLYGPSGYGKTTAALAVANSTRAYFVQIKSAWTRKALLEKILLEMGIKPQGSVAALLDQCCETLAANGRMLILDEFDYCLRHDSMIELVRDIYEGSQAMILLVGEEAIPQKLKRWERFHSRVLNWLPAHPVSNDDAAKLATIYCPQVRVDADLIRKLVAASAGSVRRVSVNLANIHEAALGEGWKSVDLKTWGDRPLYTGDAPKRPTGGKRHDHF